ncbi:hypothetical protein ABPG77_004174 [Micractinium sp. CCAP 211/92]
MATELAAAGFEGLEAADSEALFKSDSFRMQHMKVLPCSKRFVHDWTECPFAHPQEKARRRDPRVYNYTGIACPSMKKEGCCAFGDHCPYAHNVFEYWLHPTRYRTQLCNDGSNCKRKICFFAHSLDELRVPACKPFVSPEALASAAASAAGDAEAKRKAATIGSPLSAFSALAPGPSPQRSSLDALHAASLAAEARLSSASVVAPHSPGTADEMAAPPGTPRADSAVQATLAQLAGAGFTAQDQQVIELVTGLLAQEKVTPEQAATILQQMLPPGTLSQLQAHLTTPRASEDVRYSEPLSPAAAMRGGSFEGGSPARQPPQQQPGLTMEQVAAVQAAHNMGYAGGAQLASHSLVGRAGQDPSRLSMDSLRSSFDTARMSFEAGGRGSMDMLGTPRASVDAAYPSNLMSNLSGNFSGQPTVAAALAAAPRPAGPATQLPDRGDMLRSQSVPPGRMARFSSGQLSSVPEGFPIINAPPPSSWGAGRFSLDSAAERLSEDMSRMSFEGAARAAPQPTANPYTSSFFTSSPSAAGPVAGMADRRSLSLPPLPPVRTSAPARSFAREEEEAAAAAAANAAAHHHHQLLGGTAMHRLP